MSDFYLNKNFEEVDDRLEFNKEQRIKFEEFYEQYKKELPEPLMDSMKTLSLGFAMLIGYNTPEEVENELIRLAQRQIDKLQDYLNTVTETVKELRQKSNTSNGGDNHDEVLQKEAEEV